MPFDIDIAIVVAFLFLTLVVGLSKGSKLVSLKEFAVGNRQFTTAKITATLVATWISGSFLFVSIEKMYVDGAPVVLAYLAFPSMFLVMNYFFIPKMQEFLGTISVAEAMKKLYGPRVELITAMTGAISCLGMVAVQFKIFGTLFDYFLPFEGNYNLIISSVIVILYSSFGGIKSVTITDLIQFLTFTVILPLLLFLLLQNTDVASLTGYIKGSHFVDFNRIFDYQNVQFWSFLTLLFYFTFPNFPPEIFQRILLAKDIKQVKSSFNLAFVACVIIVLFTILLVMIIHYDNPNLEANKVFYYVADKYLNSGTKGLVIIGVIAMIMSTADSNMNSSSVLVVSVHNYFSKLSDKAGLIYARLYSIILGSLALIIALYSNNLLDIILTTASFYMPIVNAPLMFAILGFRTTEKCVLIAMAASLITSLSFLFLGLDAIIPAMLVNCLFLFGSHYILGQEGGWVKRNSSTEEYSDELNNIDLNKKKFSFFNYLVEQMPTNNKVITLFGIICFFSTNVIIHSVDNLLESYFTTALVLYASMLICSSFCIFYSLFDSLSRANKLALTIWYWTLFYILSFCSFLLILFSDFNHITLLVTSLNITLLSILTRWQVATVLLILGATLACLTYSYYVEVDSIFYFIKEQNIIVLSVLALIFTSIVNILKPNQEYILSVNSLLKNLQNKIKTIEIESKEKDQKIKHFDKIIKSNEQQIGALKNQIINKHN
ncbi:MAG: hypothetical protein DGJ47_000068, partial [Rickettsiaceae bacterium]